MYLFVYGSLKRGQSPLAAELWSQAEFAGLATVEGTLYRLAHYCGMVDGPGRVHGELARLLSPETIFAQLDEYQGSDYTRVLRPALLDSGATVQTMVYMYSGRLDSVAVIPSGRWPEISSE